MEYHEAANFLFDLRRYSPTTGVESTRRLLDFLGGPGEDLRVVRIAGSNGKGSTARMVESVLREAGYDVGLYTSPHLDDVRERAATVRENAETFREDWSYVGADPVRVMLVGDAVESWAGAARRYATLGDLTFDHRPDSALGVGERAGEVEHGHAYLADATHVDEQVRASLSDPPSMRETLTDARASLTDTVESHLETVPDDVGNPSDLVDTDRNLEGTPGWVALDDLHSNLIGSLEPTDDVASDVVERVRDLVFAEAFTKLRERVEDGEEFGVTSTEELGERRETAVSAVETALTESPDRRLARRLLADEIWHLRDADEALGRYDSTVVADALHWEIGDYLTLTMGARGVPPACRTGLDALGVNV